MKKLLACLIAMVMLTSLMFVGVVPAAAADEAPVPFFYSYFTEEDYNVNVGHELPDQEQAADAIAENLVETFRADNKYVHRTFGYEWGANAGGNTVLSYDAKLGAMKITTAEAYTGNPDDYPDKNFAGGTMESIHQPAKVVFAAENDDAAMFEDYPVFAVKIKLADADYAFGTGNTLIATNPNGAMGFAAKATSAGYAPTTDWQLLLLTINTDGIEIRDWRAAMVAFLPHHEWAVEAGQDVAWVQWAGAFSSADEARDYFDETADDVPVLPPEPPTADEAPAPFFYYYKTEGDFNLNVGLELPDQDQAADAIAENLVQTFRADNKYVHRTFGYEWGANAGGNTVLSYDADKGALKVSIAETYTGNPDDYPDKNFAGGTMESIHQPAKVVFAAENGCGAMFEDYPVFAVKIKLADPNYAFGTGNTLIATNPAGAMGFAAKATSAGYEPTTAWQLLIMTINTDGIEIRDWRAAMVAFLPHHEMAVEAGQDVAWIQWAGAFSSADEARDYFEETLAPGEDQEEPVGPGEGETPEATGPLFLDVTDAEKFAAAQEKGGIIAQNKDNAEVSFNATSGAAEIYLTAGGPMLDEAGGRYGESLVSLKALNKIKVTDAPVVVAKMRVNESNPDKLMKAYMGYAYTNGKSQLVKLYGDGNTEFTTDGNDNLLVGKDRWVYVAFSSPDANAQAGIPDFGVWGGLQFQMNGSTYEPGDSVEIAWVGAFESLEAARKFDLGDEVPEDPEDPEDPENPDQGGSGDQPADGWNFLDGKWYFFVDGEVLTAQWKADSKGWCYLGDDGAMVTNSWVKDSVGWCYVGADGYCVTNTWKQDSVGWCYLDGEGRMVTNNWVQDSNGWCYVGADGYCVTNTWKQDSVGWCYLNANGNMATNTWVKDSVGWCFVGADGYCVTNKWVKDSAGWCYLNAEGRMVTNAWVQDSVGWCYVGADGYCVTNTWKQDSVGWCYLDGEGRMVTDDYVKDSQGLCYLNANGYWDGVYR
ncbi:MAG: N-acetylmuramoyl-L-alanine amidase family protein [Clostridia bacterium]|nr:N-acetylmuramoyl-L-alanine amidase family protein [Clostridia bacterium]